MDSFAFFCTQQLLEELSDTSSDEDFKREEKVDVLKSLCLLNAMDDIEDTCPSSDGDDPLFAVLAYTQLLKKTENIRRHKRKNIVSTIYHQKRKISTKDIIGSYPACKVRRLNNGYDISTTSAKHSNVEKSKHLIKEEEIATVITENINEIQDNQLENNILNSSSECELKVNILKVGDYEHPNKEADLRSVLKFVEGQVNFDESVMDSLSENEVKQHFHMSRECITCIMEMFHSWYCNNHEQIRPKPNIKAVLLPFLWFCANQVSLDNVAEMFNTPLTDIMQHFDVILNFFEDILSEKIKLPSSYNEKESLTREFEKIDGFPNVLGCLVQTYLTLPEDLVQKVDSSKIYLRAIFDSRQKFLSLKVCLPKLSDSDKFLAEDLPNLCFPKYHLLGDTKCPIRDHLIKQFIKTEKLNETEEYFNMKFKRTYGRADNVFGALKTRFRQLNYCLDFSNIEAVSKFIVACCIIHNICIDKHDFYNDKLSKDESNNDVCGSLDSAQPDNFLSDLGIMKRYELSQILFRMRK